MTFQILILAILIGGFGVLVYLFSRKPVEKPDEGMKVMLEWLKEMRGTTESLQKRLDERLSETNQVLSKNITETNKAINERLDTAARVISGLQKELGGMSQIGPDIRKLSEVLASPKARGNFGEEMLEELLGQVLPKESFKVQYRFHNGETVDAIVKVGEHLLPIDSKFSLENFRLYQEAKSEETAEKLRKEFLRDVKKRIDEIHKKYILPQERTFDFAFMYVPSEGVLSEIQSDAQVTEYSRQQKVYPIGPNNLYHNLQTVMLVLRRQQFGEAAQQVLQLLNGIKQESTKFSRNLETLSRHIKDSANSMGLVVNEYGKLQTSINNAANFKLIESKQQDSLQIEKKSEVERLEDL